MDNNAETKHLPFSIQRSIVPVFIPDQHYWDISVKTTQLRI